MSTRYSKGVWVNMKCVFLLAATVVLVVAEPFYYQTADDYIDVDAVLADPPTLQAFLDCFLDRQPCTPFTYSYKKILQDSVIRACDRCNLPQKQRYAKFLWGLRTLVPHEYLNFRQKYDPQGIYFDRLEAVLSHYLEFNNEIYQRFYYLYKK